MSGVSCIASHWALQYLPDFGTQEHEGCAHFFEPVLVMTIFSEPRFPLFRHDITGKQNRCIYMKRSIYERISPHAGQPFRDAESHIEVDEMLVFSVLAMILRKNFRELPGQFFRLVAAPFIDSEVPVVSDAEPGSAHRAQFKEPDMKKRGLPNFLIEYCHRVPDFVSEHGILQLSDRYKLC
jgi:hypothetical protein